MARGVCGEKNRPVEDGEGESGWMGVWQPATGRPTAGLLYSTLLEEKQLLSFWDDRASGRENGLVPRQHRAELWAPVSARAKLRSLCF